MKGRKSHGLDGLQACFLQKYRNIIGSDITNVTLGTLNEENDISAINDTYISLITKVKNPSHIKDLRPISLCNVFINLFLKLL